MATKIDIKRFLEAKKIEVSEKLLKEKKEKEEIARNEFFDLQGFEFKNIRNQVVSAHEEFDTLMKRLSDTKIAVVKSPYYGIGRSLDEPMSKLSTANLPNYINISSVEKVSTSYAKLIDDSKNEYLHLIAVSQSMNAKDGIELLNGLGFDTSDIETKKECTALITNIDAKKLFIQGGLANGISNR